jgi:hypothetical protein
MIINVNSVFKKTLGNFDLTKISPTVQYPNMKYNTEELERIGATQSANLTCPMCKNPLVFKAIYGGIQIWCPNSNEICPCVGANDGGFGKNEKAAFEILTQKLSFGK